jgi:hypothetical protein
VVACNPSYMGGAGRRITGGLGPRELPSAQLGAAAVLPHRLGQLSSEAACNLERSRVC